MALTDKEKQDIEGMAKLISPPMVAELSEGNFPECFQESRELMIALAMLLNDQILINTQMMEAMKSRYGVVFELEGDLVEVPPGTKFN